VECISPQELARTMLRRGDILQAVAAEVRDKTKPGDKVLDPFCGSGVLLAVASRLKRQVRGCDIGPEMVDFASKLIARHGGQEGDIQVGDATSLSMPTSSFNFVITSIPGWNTVKYSNAREALEAKSQQDYWLQMRQAIGEMRRVLKPGGSCMFVQSQETAARMATLAREADLPTNFVMVPGAR